ncbi:MAG TPA: DMT family transporter [Frankiaceae bacterium]|nr:DMT family transporter [Frankiaceae bacterium]
MRSPYVRLVGLGSFWGTSFLLIKISLDGLPPLGVALGRSVFGALTLWVFVAVGRRRVPRDARLWGHLAVIAVFANALPFALFAWGELHVTSAIAGVYNATTPLFTVLSAIAALPSERATRARLAGLALGTIGVVVVLGPWREGGTNTVLGQLACLGAGASYGVGLVWVRKFISPRNVDVLVQTACQLTLATLFLAVVTPFGGGRVELTAPVVAAVLALGAFGTGVALIVYNGLIRDIGATGTSLVTFIVPVVAVALGAVALGEPVTWNLFAGAAVVIAGVRLAR